MAEEKRKISPAVGLGVAAGLAAVMYFVTKAKAAPPEEPEPGFANLYGRVTDAETGDPLAGVSVGLWSPDETELLLHTTTNSSGYYSMENILPGNYVVYFDKEGYEIVKKGDKVLVEGNNELNVEMAPIIVPEEAVEITSITLDKTMLVEEDPFTISLTFSNPLDYDIWVKPEFGFGLLTGEPLEFVEEVNRRRKLVLHGFEPEAVLSGWEYYYEPHGYSGINEEWVDLGHPQHHGSNMPQFVYDPDGIPVLMAGGECWLKVPAKGQATTSRKWYISNSARSRGWIEWAGVGFWRYPIHHVEVYPPIDLDVCVKVESAFYLVYDPGYATRTVGGVTVTVNYRSISLEPFVGAVPDVVNVRSTKTPT